MVVVKTDLKGDLTRATRGFTVENALDAGMHGRQRARAALDLQQTGLLDIRGRIDSDVPFITRSWLKSYRDEMRFTGNDVYYANHHGIIERLWVDPGVTWLVAAWPKNPVYIMGYLCGEASVQGPIVHYVYVRHAAEGENLRRLGIATRLLDTFLEGQDTTRRIWYTHSTVAARAALAGKHSVAQGAAGWEYNPYLAYRYIR